MEKASQLQQQKGLFQKDTSALAQLEVHLKQHFEVLLDWLSQWKNPGLYTSWYSAADTVPAHQAYLHLSQLTVKLLYGGSDPGHMHTHRHILAYRNIKKNSKISQLKTKRKFTLVEFSCKTQPSGTF